MITLVPNYYLKFKCIADQCKHNCCIGWEIDIDEETYLKYLGYNGDLGEKIKNSISLEDYPHFILDSKERCPFLKENGLCEIICQKGEDDLCRICKDHPRFRNQYEHFEEMGLGLCCEEAARLILTQKEPTYWVPLKQKDSPIVAEEWEAEFLSKREHLLKILHTQSIPYQKRIESINKSFSISEKSFADWKKLLLKAEKMKPILDDYLTALSDDLSFIEEVWIQPGEYLTRYFLDRHLFDSIERDDFCKRAEMSIGFSKMICAIAKSRSKSFSLEILIDTARLFSSEIEYSDQNIDYILSNL